MRTAAPGPGEAEGAVLRVDRVSKSYPGVHALSEVNFDLYPGEVHCLIGENGAGKSSLVKILAGAQQPDSGRILIKGEAVRFRGPADAKKAGIACIFQELSVVSGLTVAENVVLGAEPGAMGQFDARTAETLSRDSLERIGFAGLDPRGRVAGLSPAEKQAVMIAKALHSAARVIIMDEPTSPLEKQEVDKLFDTIARLKAQGVGIVYISHKMGEIAEIGDRVTVFKDGRNVGTRIQGESSPRELVRMMVGRDLTDVFPRKLGKFGRPVLEVGSLGGPALSDISFTVRAGEIVGIAGLAGAGRTELLRTLFGAEPRHRGSVLVDGTELPSGSIQAAIRAGVGMVPEERRTQGIVGVLSVLDNLLLPWNQFRDRRRDNKLGGHKVAGKMVRELAVRASSVGQRANLLSGGNQQKVVLGKWLVMRTGVLLLDEPTRGVDIGAKREIYRIVRDLADAGLAIVLVSSELQEVIGLSDRILVLNHGRIVGELPGDAPEAEVMELSMLHAS